MNSAMTRQLHETSPISSQQSINWVYLGQVVIEEMLIEFDWGFIVQLIQSLTHQQPLVGPVPLLLHLD